MPDKPTVPDVVPMVRAYQRKDGNYVGGHLHIVLDDGNVDDHSVEYCLAAAREAGDTDGVALAETLLRMSRTQRLKLSDMFYRLHDGYRHPEEPSDA